jgi:hypothetical protein
MLTSEAPLGGNHYGGSCQIGFSTDKGATFRTVVSYQGNCPLRHGGEDPSGQEFNFTVPEDMPVGEAVFAWTWINREQEFNMNCAAVSITTPGNVPPQNIISTSSTAQNPSAPIASPKSSEFANAAPSFDLGGNRTPNPTISSSAPTASVLPLNSALANPDTVYKTFDMTGAACMCTCEASSGQEDDFTMKGCTCQCGEEPPLKDIDGPARRHASLPLVSRQKQRGLKRRGTAFASRPEMFVPNYAAGCVTPKTNAELQFPDPGPDVVKGDGEYPVELPSGNC